MSACVISRSQILFERELNAHAGIVGRNQPQRGPGACNVSEGGAVAQDQTLRAYRFTGCADAEPGLRNEPLVLIFIVLVACVSSRNIASVRPCFAP
jgi:hypothetical protein